MKLLFKLMVIYTAVLMQLAIQVPPPKSRIVAYVDPGSDDAFALELLLYTEKIGQLKLEAIVCSLGNSDLHHVCTNTIRILETLNRTDIPIYKGASRSIVPVLNILPDRYFFGRDGFGDLNLSSEPDLSIICQDPALVAIHRLVTSNPGEITLLCLGPLTTPALTMMVYEDFASKLKEIWIMGGNYKAQGNIAQGAEFNFFIDPESANIVLRNGACSIKLFTWDTCLRVGISMNWRVNVLGELTSPFMELLNKVEHNVFKSQKMNSTWDVCDVFTSISMVYPEVVLEKSRAVASVGLRYLQDRGHLILHENKNERNVIIIEKISTESVKTVLIAVNT